MATTNTASECFPTPNSSTSNLTTHSSQNLTPNLNDMPNEVLEKIVKYLPMSSRVALLSLRNIRLQNVIKCLHACKSNTIVNLISRPPSYEPKSLQLIWKAIKQSCSTELWHLTAGGLDKQARPSLSARQQHWTTLKVDGFIINCLSNENRKMAISSNVASQLEPEFTHLPASAFTQLQVRYMTFSENGFLYIAELLKQIPSSQAITNFQLLVARSNVEVLLEEILKCFFSYKKSEPHPNATRTLKHLSIFISSESGLTNPSEEDCFSMINSGRYEFLKVEELLLGGINPRTVKYLLGYCFPALRRLVILTRKEETPTVDDFDKHLSMIPLEVCAQITHLAVRSVKSIRKVAKTTEQLDDQLVAYVKKYFPAVVSLNGQVV